ncbi:MAG: response regulator [Deltaproteobacteria bacterium]|nr:response regulator [Deltaproteobacteria bacterium]
MTLDISQNAPSDSDKRVLLIVDDEDSVLRFITRLFENEHRYETITAKDVKTAFELITDRNPDVVLMNIYFRDRNTNSIECVRHARNTGYRGIICMFTGDTSAKLLLETAMAGADDFIFRGPQCNLIDEINRLYERRIIDCGSTSRENTIEAGGFLRSLGLREEQISLLAEYAALGYPRVKEFANQLDVPEYVLWKRLARIRNKLEVDSMPQIVHLLTATSVFEISRASNRKDGSWH